MSGTQPGSAFADPNEGARASAVDPDIDVEVDEPGGQSPDTSREPPAPRRDRPADRASEGFEGRRAGKRIARLVAQRNAAQDRLIELERQNAELQRQNLQVGQLRLNAEERRAQAQIDAAERELRAAIAENDDDRTRKAQAALSELNVDLGRVREAKIQVDRAVATPPPAPSSDGFTPATRAWIDDNPWFTSDPAMKQVAIGFDAEARRRGITPESREYFAHIDRRMRAAFPDYQFDDDDDDDGDRRAGRADDRRGRAADVDVDVDVEPRARQPAAASAAAPRRSPGAAGPQNQQRRTIKLTQEQLDIARSLKITPNEYAASLERRRKSGDIR